MIEPPALPDASSAMSPAPRAGTARARCPRCGAPLGRLAADDATAFPTDRYCGCCGLVIPGAADEAAS